MCDKACQTYPVIASRANVKIEFEAVVNDVFVETALAQLMCIDVIAKFVDEVILGAGHRECGNRRIARNT